ncbi:hypothetical protein CMO96_01890 [Candidatus Woesebacteria bacterium]|nr:hypothetical protein [Candidatus Woesebacteria bacterium]|tara:strand:- start:478 stop:1548 length:1071 start_codon:yes stop_codon:yes gene_type:complete
MTLLIFVVLLSILVFVHELGHYLAARRAGIKVEEFGFGFPPRVWSKKIGETLFSINLIPIGGFVRLYGEDESVVKDKERAFYHKGKLARVSIVIAGVVMNILLAVAAFSILVWVTGIPKETGKVQILEVAEGSPAAIAGIQKDDIVVSVEGQSVYETNVFVELVGQSGDAETSLVIERGDGQEVILGVTPRSDPPEGEGALGVVISSVEMIQPPIWQRPFVSVWYGAGEAIFWVKTVAVAVATSVSQLIHGETPQVTGPVGIFQMTGAVARQGIFALISFAGIISINLAVLNILPIPALDGGRLLFIIVETIFGRRVVPAVERYAHAGGMVLLLFLILAVTVMDVRRLLGGFLPIP